nr:Chain A, jasmintide js3 [Jasminum sambac]
QLCLLCQTSRDCNYIIWTVCRDGCCNIS